MGRQWPLPRGKFTITSRFAGRINPVTGQAENHSGTDFAAPDGTPFYACAGGTVQYIGAASGYGQWIVLDHPDSEGGGCTEYGHMWNAFATGLKQGQWVEAGQLIGYIGSNGQSTGPHLHLTVWERGYGGRRIDPETWLAGRPYPGDVPKPAASSPAAPAVRAATGAVLDWTRRFNFGTPRPLSAPTGICIHVTVNTAGTPAENVATYQINTQSGSYHELTDTTPKHLTENTDDWNVWAAGPTSNARHLHRSFVMWGTETRVDWLKHDKMLRDAAARDAAWAKKYYIPVVKLTGADLRAGKKGFFGHIETAQAWGETDHVDPGAGFPWDIYLGYVRDAMNGDTKKQKEEEAMLTAKYFVEFIKGYFGPVVSDLKDVRQQITGGRDAGQYPGWSISQLVKNLRAKKGDNATIPEMLALLIIEQQEMKTQITELKEKK